MPQKIQAIAAAAAIKEVHSIIARIAVPSVVATAQVPTVDAKDGRLSSLALVTFRRMTRPGCCLESSHQEGYVEQVDRTSAAEFPKRNVLMDILFIIAIVVLIAILVVLVGVKNELRKLVTKAEWTNHHLGQISEAHQNK